VFTSKLVPARFTKLLRRDLNLLQPIAAQEVRLARLAAAHCASRCSTASAAAFSAAVLWRHLVLAMAERDDGGRSRQPHCVRRDATRLTRPATRVSGLSTVVVSPSDAHCGRVDDRRTQKTSSRGVLDGPAVKAIGLDGVSSEKYFFGKHWYSISMAWE
jgi:hypothetical protein